MVPDRHYCASATLLSVLMLCLLQIFARSLHADDVSIVQCVPTNCSRPCPTLPPVCRSKLIRNCGCCDVCWIFLGEGDVCDTPVPENVVCGPNLRCNYEGRCEVIPLEENVTEK
ncbi:uncharacterized protein LOC126210642 [Schistocerca nitens]|uniref:uncharacterized protein LOC126210642 n=1 Tax=Schistocerca nitens TaxID=7011 RepID=UPI002118E25B|nr:uncharacterized protein LOC126210642 [Schistocerca nitens]